MEVSVDNQHSTYVHTYTVHTAIQA